MTGKKKIPGFSKVDKSLCSISNSVLASVVVPDSDKEDNASFSSCKLDSEESTVMISSRSTSHEQTPISRSGVEDEEEGCNTERDVDATAALKKGKGKRKRTDDTGTGG